ncbi:MAG: hypothetical protein IIB83_00865 [Bacteroidetes bacterium]|nr:hypothetical protein [Bacteroidota bacterium]
MKTLLIAAIPQMFYDDHVERELPSPCITAIKGRRYICEGSNDEWTELLSDARYYSDVIGFDFEGMHSMARSARATVKAIRAQLTLT